MKPTFKEFLTEVKVRQDDPGMQDYYADTDYTPGSSEDQQAGTAPYAVGWGGQYHEWYGDDDPTSGQGRYKSKGEGGEIVAVNVPDYQTAEKLRDQLDRSYEDGSFQNKMVYHKWGKEHGVVHYDGAYIKPMSELGGYDRKFGVKNAKDYSK